MKPFSFLKKHKGKILLGILSVLVLLRIALPYVLLHYANKTLAEMEGYYGHVEDINVALFRGAYVLDSFYLDKVDTVSLQQTEFLSAQVVDLSLEWKALLKGSLAGNLRFTRPVVRFTEDKVDLRDVASDTSDFRTLLHNFMPIKVNRCEIHDGRIRYIDNTTSPKIDLAVTHLTGVALNLRNAYESGEVLPASIKATGELYGGTLRFSMKLNPLAKLPTFDLNTSLEHTHLVELNDLFLAYGHFDVSKGEFNLYAEAATEGGQFAGYVKPIIHGLDVVEWKGQDKHDKLPQKIWESVVEGATEVLKNHPRDQFATKINFRGKIDSLETSVFEAVVIIFQNAFIQALKPAIENQITLSKLAESIVVKRRQKFFEKRKKKKGEK